MTDGIAPEPFALAHAGPTSDATLVARLRPATRFAAHFVELVLAMLVGMAVLGIPVDAIARSQGYDDVYHQLPELGAIVMTLIMTGPMAAWMAVRGHDRSMIGEMSLAMIVPVFGLIVAARIGLLATASIPMLADPLMYAAMLAVMLARWRMYAGLDHAHGARSDPRGRG